MELWNEGTERPVTTIRATCPTCGDVEFTSDEVTVRLCTADNQGSYAFRCPGCALSVAKPADAKVVDVLTSSGARVVVWDLPAELGEIHSGAPISYDDLLQFHYALQQPGWFDRLISSGAPEDRR